jgi:hypothetical protein
MDAGERKSLAQLLKKGRYKWRMRLPAEAGTFCGRRISLEISPLLWGKRGEPPLTSREIRLVEQILEHLPRLVRKAEREWWGYRGDPDFPQTVKNPRIWIRREDQAGDKKGEWAFVIEQRNDPERGGFAGYGWHVEFKGMRFLEIWAGS